MNDKTLGLYGKFEVKRLDGSSRFGGKHHECDYFVLDITHDPYAVVALRAYAESCETSHPLLARDLRAKLAVPELPKWTTCTKCENPDYCRESLRGCDIDEINR